LARRRATTPPPAETPVPPMDRVELARLRKQIDLRCEKLAHQLDCAEHAAKVGENPRNTTPMDPWQYTRRAEALVLEMHALLAALNGTALKVTGAAPGEEAAAALHAFPSHAFAAEGVREVGSKEESNAV
jgi:hypothetical protein